MSGDDPHDDDPRHDDPHRSDETTTGTDPDAEFDRPGYEDVSLGQAAERDARLADELVATSDDVAEAEERFGTDATGAPALRDRPGGDGTAGVERDPIRLLGLYLGDHGGGAAAALQVARRARDRNSGNEFGEFLAGLHRELGHDRDEFQRIARALGIEPKRWKEGLGTVAATLGSLKPSGRLTSYSPLSRVLELESLMAAVEGKLRLWDALRFLQIDPAKVSPDELDGLSERARVQLDDLRTHHREAVVLAFGLT